MAGDTDANNLFERFWKWHLEESPEFASYCGNHDYDEMWDDISEDAYLKRQKDVQGFLCEAEALDMSSCSKTTQTSLTLLIEDFKTYLNGCKFKSYLFPVSYLEGIHNELHHLVGYHSFTTADGFEKYMKRIKALPERILQIIPLLKLGLKEGLVMHEHTMNGVTKQLDTMMTEKPNNSIIMEPFSKTSSFLTKDVRESLKKEALHELTTNIRPSLEELKEFIEKKYMNHTRKAEGISTLKDGVDFYQTCLDFHLSCEMSPQKVHDIGLKEVARIRKQMLDIAKKEGFGNDLKAFQEKLHTSEEFAFKSEDELMAYVEDICFNQIQPKLSTIFRKLTDIPLVLKRTPASQANAPGGFYSAGTADKSRPGIYYVNGNRLEACKKYDFMALSLHEGVPGHHLQQSLSFSESLPIFRQYIEDSKYYMAPRCFSMYTAYIEGWGLYCESLGVELGLYTDNYSLFGKYSGEMLRAARLVVDTGLHSMGWTQQKAVKYLVDNTLSDEWSLTNEINRYITWPGQACAYKIGELKLWELRRKAEKALGKLFDVRDYHAAVLDCGPVPLTFLETAIDEYIDTTKVSRPSPAKKGRV